MIEDFTCPRCMGRTPTCDLCEGAGIISSEIIECPNCSGGGGFKDGVCVQCEGYGSVPKDYPTAIAEANGYLRD